MPLACKVRFSASKEYVNPLPSRVMLPAASQAYAVLLLMWLLPSTVTLRGYPEHCVRPIEFKFASASGVKLCPQQSTPEVACVAAELMRFSGSYWKLRVRPLSTLLVMLAMVPLLPPGRLYPRLRLSAVPAEDVACVAVYWSRLL